MAGTRSALIVACAEYADPGLARLRAPAHDAQALAEVLEDPDIGNFEVRLVLDQPDPMVRREVARFFANRGPEDTLLVHFSCHGVKDETGQLYFATSDTELDALDATAVPAEFVHRQMSKSRSRRVVLLLDCCYSGAFARGMQHRADESVDLQERFQGRGRTVLTASSAMEYAFEGDNLTRDAGRPSVFTSALVQGLRTGDADRGGDGYISVDELYDYVFDQVQQRTPGQTPRRWSFDVEGELIIATSARPAPAELPADLQAAIANPFPGARLAAVTELARLLTTHHRGLATAARTALEALRDTDDSNRIRDAAATMLESSDPAAVETGEDLGIVLPAPVTSPHMPDMPQKPPDSTLSSPQAPTPADIDRGREMGQQIQTANSHRPPETEERATAERQEGFRQTPPASPLRAPNNQRQTTRQEASEHVRAGSDQETALSDGPSIIGIRADERSTRGRWRRWLLLLVPVVLAAGAIGVVLLRDTGSNDGGGSTGRTFPHVRAVAATPDGTRVVSGSADNTVKVWDLATGANLLTLTGHTGPVNGVVVTPDGRRVVSCSDDETVKVWDLATGTEQLTLTSNGRVTAVAVTADGRRLVSGSEDHVKVWDLATRAELLTLTADIASPVYALAVTPDGRRVIGSGSGVTVWDLATGAHLTLRGHPEVAHALAVMPDGKRLVSGSLGGMKVWDMATGAEQLTLSGGIDVVKAAVVTPDGSRVISGSEDGTVKVWDLATGAAQLTMTGHTSSVNAVAVTPDGRRVVSGSEDGTVKVWDLATGAAQLTMTE